MFRVERTIRCLTVDSIGKRLVKNGIKVKALCLNRHQQ